MNFHHSDIFSSEWWISITGMNINHSDEFLFQWGIFVTEILSLSSILTIIQSKPQPQFWLSSAQLSLSLFNFKFRFWFSNWTLLTETACFDKLVAGFPGNVAPNYSWRLVDECIFWCLLTKVKNFATDENTVFGQKLLIYFALILITLI